MLNYAKAMKEFLSKKRRLGEFETNKLPHKLKDLGSFTIPCNIGESYYSKALCDLGSSINLMPTSVFRRLGIGKVRSTTVTLQLTDQSFPYLEGKIEDVLVRVDKFIFPTDFIILDFEIDKKVSIILGRPFLAICRTIIDVQKGEPTMRVQAVRSPDEVKNCSTISETDLLVPTKLEFNYSNNLLKGISFDSSHQDEDETCLKANSEGSSSKAQFESLELSSHEYRKPNPSREKPL
ncbi:hypothetical protein EPI10_002408 [Gossypium australe]|uniref:Retrovirus-related Pol polyprotein from transposon opus n=1 Tax=Gossypium australe TaxID=47621 RepID=A0A5B6VE26_9ROSI|nr:hypothetical protein EPI10_002408 [Gossypium australe]